MMADTTAQSTLPFTPINIGVFEVKGMAVDTMRAWLARGLNLPLCAIRAQRSAGVKLLFCATNPPAIFKGIGSIVINPIKSHAFRRLSHIGQKVVEFQPTLADSDAAPPVVRPTLMGRLGTALDHLPPSLAETRSTTLSPISAITSSGTWNSRGPFGAATTGPFGAATTHAISASEMAHHNHALSTAITNATPDDTCTSSANWLQGNQPSEALVSQVEFFPHKGIVHGEYQIVKHQTSDGNRIAMQLMATKTPGAIFTEYQTANQLP